MRSYVDLLRALMRWEPRVHIFGGISEDALLHGRMTRAHSDVDLVVLRRDLETRLEQARALGFRHFHLRMESWQGVPLVVGAVEGALNLELVIFDEDETGRVHFDVPTARGMKRVWLPDDAFSHAPSMLEGVAVRTVSPLAQYQIRTAVAETFGGFRPKDRLAQTALRERFFRDAREEDLEPEVAWVDAPVAAVEARAQT